MSTAYISHGDAKGHCWLLAAKFGWADVWSSV